ncbi:MAG: (2Fe-2S)-binding protein [Planctomycetes bacterium]|nr:(2Fe-2S)-binding protein [Planctomycetota bacterium]
MKTTLHLKLNGRDAALEVAPHARLLDVLRDVAGLTGAKEGCGEGECGACTVLVDGRAVNSCLFPALEAEGRSVVTIEGLAGAQGGLSSLQQAFVQEGGAQCGFCTPGMVMSAAALLSANRDPSDDEIRDALVGNLCRCTGYAQIVASIRAAAGKAGAP